MPISAHDVAREIRERLPSIGVVKVHKLLYFCQGWHAAWYGGELFPEAIEAWENGPVVADLWNDEKYYEAPPKPDLLAEDAMVVVEYVTSRYGRLSARDLIELTHFEGPWRQAWDRGVNSVISVEEIAAFFGQDQPSDEDVEWNPMRNLSRETMRRLAEAASRPLGDDIVDDTDALRQRWASLAG